MSFKSKKNNAYSKVATVGGIDASTDPVTFSCVTGEGSRFPTANFLISIDNEILLCTARTGDSFTCSRNQESSGIAAHSQNADMESRITGGSLDEITDVFDKTKTTSNAEDILLVQQASAPTTPGTGHMKIYAKNDDKIYKIDDAGVETELGAGSGGASFWADVPGTPTRVSDTQFTITDTSNANLYDKLFGKGTIIKWLESTTVQMAMVVSASYGANTVTINVVGNSLTAGFTAMKYCLQRAIEETFIITPFPTAATTNLAKTAYLKEEAYLVSYDLQLTGAGASTGSTIVDINANGSTLATTKATITGTNTSDLDNVLDNVSGNTLTATAKDSAITVDVDSVTATAPTGDGIVTLFIIPVSWRYR